MLLKWFDQSYDWVRWFTSIFFSVVNEIIKSSAFTFSLKRLRRFFNSRTVIVNQVSNCARLWYKPLTFVTWLQFFFKNLKFWVEGRANFEPKKTSYIQTFRGLSVILIPVNKHWYTPKKGKLTLLKSITSNVFLFPTHKKSYFLIGKMVGRSVCGQKPWKNVKNIKNIPRALYD
jgi:hypothetical protein